MLTLAVPLDREEEEQWSLKLVAEDFGLPSLSSSIAVSLTVLDVNDNAPRISGSTSLIHIAEDVPRGAIIHTVESIDPDLGKNGSVRYQLDLASRSFFRIHPVNGKIFTSAVLDFEKIPSHTLTVIARDEGNPLQLSSQIQLTVSLVDVNDNAPEIVSGPTVVLKNDNNNNNTVIHQIRARDKDSGLNAKLRFSLRSTAASSEDHYHHPSQHFKLDADSGSLSLLTPRKDLAFGEYRLDFEVSDSASPSLRKTTSGILVVLNLSDDENRQQQGPHFSQRIYHASITENSPVGTPIGHVRLLSNNNSSSSSTPEGEEDGGDMLFQYITESGGRDLFVVDRSSGQVRSKRAIDREEDGDRISIRIFAVTHSWFSACQFDVEILDVNDNPPVIQSFDLRGISEDFLPGTPLGFVFAVDDDLLPSSPLEYHLEDSEFVSIDAQSGNLSLTKEVDRELNSKLSIGLTVTDGQHETRWNKELQVKYILFIHKNDLLNFFLL